MWLAVTSLSFDISVLELFWTLARGFKVVLYGGRASHGRSAPSGRARAERRPIDFSLFYFASDEGGTGGDKYRLLLEGRSSPTRNGFAAVWTPERHFHAFGGLYPEPVGDRRRDRRRDRAHRRSARAASCCRCTTRSASPRSGRWWTTSRSGRVGISFASGWQPNDFVLAPGELRGAQGDHVERHRDGPARCGAARSVALPGADGQDGRVRTLPAAGPAGAAGLDHRRGQPRDLRRAGELGANVLTHLLGQTSRRWRRRSPSTARRWRGGGAPGDGHVTLMLHTFVGDDVDAVRETVREPF